MFCKCLHENRSIAAVRRASEQQQLVLTGRAGRDLCGAGAPLPAVQLPAAQDDQISVLRCHVLGYGRTDTARAALGCHSSESHIALPHLQATRMVTVQQLPARQLVAAEQGMACNCCCPRIPSHPNVDGVVLHERQQRLSLALVRLLLAAPRLDGR